MLGEFGKVGRRVAACAGLALAMALAGCGGGGGGDGAAAPAVTFTPSGLVANVQAGTSATLTVRATATDVSLFSRQVYVFIVDTAGVLLPSLELASVDSRTVSATLHTQPTLAVGRHAGEFSVRDHPHRRNAGVWQRRSTGRVQQPYPPSACATPGGCPACHGRDAGSTHAGDDDQPHVLSSAP